ncbi:hypothetical protein [Shewanella sp. YLB-07]|uniref:hypothetical protein n=1 Tax=Shewanella sp. YLB-07 TaxID=2601268 RepID=UPI00128E5464|nr:hypothetical protein [Shewanella sp. YLB-07]MPY24355.1 hypothetical protein [Shewanella sp. YLB-07]
MAFEKETLEALKTHQAEYLNTVWKTFAALMVSIGWILSSAVTRDFLSSSPTVKSVAIGVVLLMAVMHWLSLNDLYLKSRQISLAMSVDSAVYQAIAQSYVIKRVATLASFFINGLLYSLLITLIVGGKVMING